MAITACSAKEIPDDDSALASDAPARHSETTRRCRGRGALPTGTWNVVCSLTTRRIEGKRQPFAEAADGAVGSSHARGGGCGSSIPAMSLSRI